MIRRCGAAFVLAIALPAALHGQQATEIVNVMPVWMPRGPAQTIPPAATIRAAPVRQVVHALGRINRKLRRFALTIMAF